MEENKDKGNIVFIGNKEYNGKLDYKLYYNVIMKVLSNHPEAIIKTRGKRISDAVSLATFIERIKGKKITEIKATSEKFEGKDGKERYVPEISITLK